MYLLLGLVVGVLLGAGFIAAISIVRDQVISDYRKSIKERFVENVRTFHKKYLESAGIYLPDEYTPIFVNYQGHHGQLVILFCGPYCDYYRVLCLDIEGHACYGSTAHKVKNISKHIRQLRDRPEFLEDFIELEKSLAHYRVHFQRNLIRAVNDLTGKLNEE
jgi:hypothetical protein